MRIVHIAAGAGGTFYCQNCLRDAAVAKALIEAGHETLMVPLYLPLLREPDETASEAGIFFGGINVYLQQKSALFRKTPRWVDKMLDSPRLLKLAAGAAGMTSANDLAEITLSMLRGPDGRQVKELNRLVDFLSSQPRPDVICLSNALLLGLAETISRRLGAPLAVMLQDEDIFIDDLPEPARTRAWEIMMDHSRGVGAFIAVSHYYAERMRRRLSLPAERVHVVYVGIDPSGYEVAPGPVDPPTIGYLERMCPQMGLDILAEAFVILKSGGRFERLRLRIAGGKTGADERFIRQVRGRLAAAGVAGDVEFPPNFDRGARLEFLRGLSVLSVPARHAEAFGTYVLESLAGGVPVILPDRGAFPELLKATGGGLLCRPDSPRSLAAQLERVLSDAELAKRLGRTGRRAVLERFNIKRMAEDVAGVYQGIVAQRSERNRG